MYQGKHLSAKATAQRVPAYVTRLLAPGEGVRHLTRPSWVALDLLVLMLPVALGLVVYSALLEPGFIRLLALPALPLLGSMAAAFSRAPLIVVTDRRFMFARRFRALRYLSLEWLEAIRVHQHWGGRLLGYGELLLSIRRPPGMAEPGVFGIRLGNLPDAAALGSAISAAAAALHLDVPMSGPVPVKPG